MKHIITIKYPGEFSRTFSWERFNPNETPSSIREELFGEWNAGSGRESVLFMQSQVRSFSVNDFVCIDGSWFQCDSVGWHSVNIEYVNEVEGLVTCHPLYFTKGAWYALQDVMR